MSFGFNQSSSDKGRDILALIAAVILTRWVFRSEHLVHMDSINFALGIIDYNPVTHQPHPPGYFLYIMLGKALYYFTADPASALLLISISASVAAAIFVYLLTYEWFGRTAAIFSGLLILTSPFTWFYGTVALTYIVEFCLVSLVGLLCWYVSTGRTQFLVPAAIVMGLAVGFRQSSILFLAPLCLYSLCKLEIKYWVTAVIVFGVTVFAWFIPMLLASGGSDAYFTALNDLWSRVASPRTVFAFAEKEGLWNGVLLAFLRLFMVASFFVISFTATAPFILMRGLSLGSWDNQKLFTLFWMIPGILFFTFMYLSPANMGYMAVIFPPLFAIIGAKAAKWYEQIEGRWHFKAGFVTFLMLVNTIVFIYVPFYMGYQKTKNYENDIALTSEALRKSVNPDNTLIIALDVVKYGFRQAGYYSPTHLVVQYPEMRLSSGIKVFAMRGRKTVLLDKLPTEKYSRFVIFPTPRHKQAQDKISAMFPEGSISTISKNGYSFLEGRSSELKYLFPETAAQ